MAFWVDDDEGVVASLLWVRVVMVGVVASSSPQLFSEWQEWYSQSVSMFRGFDKEEGCFRQRSKGLREIPFYIQQQHTQSSTSTTKVNCGTQKLSFYRDLMAMEPLSSCDIGCVRNPSMKKRQEAR
jgi:hypothetical protein